MCSGRDHLVTTPAMQSNDGDHESKLVSDANGLKRKDAGAGMFIPQISNAGELLFSATRVAGFYYVDTPNGASVAFRHTMEYNDRHSSRVADYGAVLQGDLRYDQRGTPWLEVRFDEVNGELLRRSPRYASHVGVQQV